MPVPTSAVRGPLADARLAALGVSADEPRDAVLVGYTAAASCTEHDPRTLAGTLAWGKTIGHLRDLMKPRGWRADSASNYETVVHPSNGHAIAVAGGTAETGRADGAPPRTRTPKGPATSRAVDRNAQMSLGEGTSVFSGTAEPVDDEERVTWLLLHYYDRD